MWVWVMSVLVSRFDFIYGLHASIFSWERWCYCCLFVMSFYHRHLAIFMHFIFVVIFLQPLPLALSLNTIPFTTVLFFLFISDSCLVPSLCFPAILPWSAFFRWHEYCYHFRFVSFAPFFSVHLSNLLQLLVFHVIFIYSYIYKLFFIVSPKTFDPCASVFVQTDAILCVCSIIPFFHINLLFLSIYLTCYSNVSRKCVSDLGISKPNEIVKLCLKEREKKKASGAFNSFNNIHVAQRCSAFWMYAISALHCTVLYGIGQY